MLSPLLAPCFLLFPPSPLHLVQVGDALSSAAVNPEARDLKLGDALSLYRGICDQRHECADRDRDDGLGLSMVAAEADYLQTLLGLLGSDEIECDGAAFSRLLMMMLMTT